MSILHFKTSVVKKNKTVCHNDHSFMDGCTVTLSNLMLDDGTNCNVHEVVTVIDLYICLGPLYISVIIFDSLSKWCHVHTRMLSTAHQVVCIYRVPGMIMTFEENVVICIMWPLCVTFKVLQTQHLFCLFFYYWLSTWRLNLYVPRRQRPVQLFFWGLTTFWWGQYFDHFAIDQRISIFSALNTGNVEGGGVGEKQ